MKKSEMVFTVPKVLWLVNASVPNTLGQISTRFFLPEGWWWRITNVSAGIGASGGVSAQPVLLNVDEGVDGRWATALPTPLAIGGFIGMVTLAIEAGSFNGGVPNVANGPLPNTLCRGGWQVNLVVPGVGNTCFIDTPNLIAEAVGPVDEQSLPQQSRE